MGAAVESWDPEGRPLIEEVGELVITRPMPSMPVFFWGDDSGERYRDSYFSMYPGVWRHGDWIEITSRQTAVIYGRSDSTINRGGVRMGTSEIYRAVLGVDDVVDALVVDVPREGAEAWMPLFVVLREGRRSPMTWSATFAGGYARTARRATCRTRSGKSTRSRGRCPGRCWKSR